jgi:PAS domain S-box-containing protein
MSSVPGEVRTPGFAAQSEEQALAALIEGAPDAVVVIGWDGRVTRWNARAEAMLGWSADEAVGALLGELIVPPSMRQAHAAGLDRVVRTGESRLIGRPVELQAMRRDGALVPIELTLARLEQAGEPAFVGFLRDMRERRETLNALRDAQEVFHLAFANAPIGMALVAPDGRWLQINDAICEMTGYRRDELLAKTFQDITHPADLDADLDQVRRILAGEIASYDMEKRYIRADGALIWVLLSVSLVRDEIGSPLYFISQIQDITARRRIEGELRRSNAELEQFAYAASHDLSEPLRTISGFADLLNRRHAESLPAEAQEFLAYMSDGAVRMHELLQALLRYARLGEGTIERVPVDLQEVAQDVLADLHATIRDRGAAVDVLELPTVLGDQAQLRQLLHNLVANALKFTPPERGPEVEVSAGRQADGWRIDVADRGIGIPPERVERAFELFRRVHTGGEYPGTGMGLALCKKVVDRHGGHIWIAPTPGGGTTVSFTLPDRG